MWQWVQVILYFFVIRLIHFEVVEPLCYSFIVETIYVKLYYFRCVIHRILFCWFLCLVNHA